MELMIVTFFPDRHIGVGGWVSTGRRQAIVNCGVNDLLGADSPKTTTSATSGPMDRQGLSDFGGIDRRAIIRHWRAHGSPERAAELTLTWRGMPTPVPVIDRPAVDRDKRSAGKTDSCYKMRNFVANGLRLLCWGRGGAAAAHGHRTRLLKLQSDQGCPDVHFRVPGHRVRGRADRRIKPAATSPASSPARKRPTLLYRSAAARIRA